MSLQVALRSFSFPASLLAYRIPVMRQLLDVMNKAEELPLCIDLLLAAQREAFEPLVVSDVSVLLARSDRTQAAIRITGTLNSRLGKPYSDSSPCGPTL